MSYETKELALTKSVMLLSQIEGIVSLMAEQPPFNNHSGFIRLHKNLNEGLASINLLLDKDAKEGDF